MVFLQSVTLQAAIQRAAAQSQSVRRVADVAVVTRERLLDQKCLHFFKAHVLEARGRMRAGAQRQIAQADHVVLRHQHGAFH